MHIIMQFRKLVASRCKERREMLEKYTQRRVVTIHTE